MAGYSNDQGALFMLSFVNVLTSLITTRRKLINNVMPRSGDGSEGRRNVSEQQ